MRRIPVRATRKVGIVLVSAGLLCGCAASVPDPPRAQWDETPPPPDVGKEHAPLPALTDDQAIAAFERRAKQNPNEAENYLILGRLHLRRAGKSKGGALPDLRAAEACFRKVIQINPNRRGATTYLAVALLGQHRFTEALELSQKAFAASPGDSLALATTGDALLELGRYEEAEKAYNDLAAIERNAPALARLAHLAEIKGDPTEALRLLGLALDQETRSGAAASD